MDWPRARNIVHLEADPPAEQCVKVLIAGPTGYVGRRLLLRVQQENRIGLRVLTRDARRIRQDLRPQTEIVEGDPYDRIVLQQAVRGIDVAYYPIRFASLERDFALRSREFARNLRDSCIQAGLNRIIHLGLLGAQAFHDSSSRMQPIIHDNSEILNACPERIQTISLYPGIIIGPGSVFYEMAINLVKKLPVLFLPRWTQTEVKVLALSDVVEYLVRAASLHVKGNLTIEIGTEQIRAVDLFKLATRIMRQSKEMIPIPVTVPRLSAFLLTFATPFSYPVSLTIVQLLHPARSGQGHSPPDRAKIYFPDVSPLTCEEAMEKAFTATDTDDVESRWTDSLAGIPYQTSETEMRRARYRDVRQQDYGDMPRDQVFRSVLSLGGERGWFAFDILWRMRGLMDKLLGGFGTSLGRRSPTELRIGDMLDVWRVVDLIENERLLLEAQMKVFGKAWLEFNLQGTTLTQTAYYEPHGALGTLYWHVMLPFHAFIFPDMAESIIRRAQG
jgi:uncharacterized protein YbjT (DUF2867 family)